MSNRAPCHKIIRSSKRENISGQYLQYPPGPAQAHAQTAQARPAFSPPTVPGMKTLADIEAEMMFGPPRHQAPPQGEQK